MKNQNLTQLVRKICKGDYCQAELVSFINLAQKISLSYLKYQEVLGKRISGERLDTEVELDDLALDCIAELFSRNEDGQFEQLKRYYEPKFEENPDITEPEVMVLTRRLIVKKTKQELSRIFRERDPEGAKIVRNIKVAIRNCDKLYVFNELGKDYIFYTNGYTIESKDVQWNTRLLKYLRKGASPIPEDVLQSHFLDVYNPNDSMATMVRKLLQSIHSLEDYQNYVPLDSIVKLMRNMKMDSFRERMAEEESVQTPLDHLESKEIESYIDVVMEIVWGKIESQYLRTGKLDNNRGEIYHKALRDVLYDLIQKKNNSSYYRNLKYYLPELTQREYRQNERSVFEYLAKVAKKEFRKHLEELL